MLLHSSRPLWLLLERNRILENECSGIGRQLRCGACLRQNLEGYKPLRTRCGSGRLDSATPTFPARSVSVSNPIRRPVASLAAPLAPPSGGRTQPHEKPLQGAILSELVREGAAGIHQISQV